jgi:hypothetical protein
LVLSVKSNSKSKSLNMNLLFFFPKTTVRKVCCRINCRLVFR